MKERSFILQKNTLMQKIRSKFMFVNLKNKTLIQFKILNFLNHLDSNLINPKYGGLNFKKFNKSVIFCETLRVGFSGR